MATIFVKHGDEFPFENTTETGIKSGDIVVMNDVVGVAITDILPSSKGTVHAAGVIEAVKTTGQAWAQGQKVYYNAADKKFTTSADSGGQTPTAYVWAGWAYIPALSAAASGQVKLKIS